MEKQTNINTYDSSIFLRQGAFVRWEGRWHLYEVSHQTAEFSQSEVNSIFYQKFFDSKSSFLAIQGHSCWSGEEWQNLFKSEKLSGLGSWSGPFREDYSQAFFQTKQRIQEGIWEKGVPVVFATNPATPTSTTLKSLLAQLSDVPDALIPFGFWKPGEGVIGATPEILYYRQDRIVKSMALAGTQPKSESCTLLADSKNLKEHQFVVNELRKKWQQFGEVQVSETKILELPFLYHLLTEFTVQLFENVSNEALVQAFHPTSALGVFPHERWRELESLPLQDQRDYFGAPMVFPLDKPGECLALVSLRQIQWNSQGTKLVAGGGVVEESLEELEWQEILAKMDSTKKSLGV